MKLRLLVTGLCALWTTLAATAASIDGQWTAEFDTMIGVQKYVFEFKTEGDRLTGRAIGEREGEKAEVKISEGHVQGDALSFVELLNFQGMDLRIAYQGRLTGPGEIKLTRRVGDAATEELVARRVQE